MEWQPAQKAPYNKDILILFADGRQAVGQRADLAGLCPAPCPCPYHPTSNFDREAAGWVDLLDGGPDVVAKLKGG